MVPCESWPARLALTQAVATALAYSSDAPAARSSAVPMRVRRSAWTIGMAFHRGRPRERRVLLVVAGSMFSKRWLESKGRISGWPCRRHGLMRCEFHRAKPAAALPGKSRGQPPPRAGLRIHERNRSSSGLLASLLALHLL